MSAPPAPPAPPAPLAAAPVSQSIKSVASAQDTLAKLRAVALEVDLSAPSAASAAKPLERTQCPRCEAMILSAEFSTHQTNHSSLILPFLYLGAERNAHNIKELTYRTNITFILNVSWEAAETYPDQFVYKRIPISDKADEPIALHFKEAFEFIEQARKSGKNVLVHCVQGISRSATLTIAYLMWHKRIPLSRALAHVKHCRPVINPNRGFMEKLKEFEKEEGLDVNHNIEEDSELLASAGPCNPKI
jgi:dual specificity MAP kinase phosphatase